MEAPEFWFRAASLMEAGALVSGFKRAIACKGTFPRIATPVALQSRNMSRPSTSAWLFSRKGIESRSIEPS